MTKDKALKLALEALEIEEAQTHYPSQWLLKAITAIKEALAQPEPEYVAFMDVPHRPWVGLTDEEKQEWIDAMPRFPEPRHLTNLLNIMEARLKEANK